MSLYNNLPPKLDIIQLTKLSWGISMYLVPATINLTKRKPIKPGGYQSSTLN
ncbi:protein of unknown function [Vibrio tapetis subsp. tapetis]|uniref:Uncharacterized protein n=1 Tax=Vibrio tapetis subsp. tapetis TaxID=1671868 RepID=A0A2N8ZIY2_9VIBR|nr:protein of unknown function [Vibrio tapetis subsp. tapetis]